MSRPLARSQRFWLNDASICPRCQVFLQRTSITQKNTTRHGQIRRASTLLSSSSSQPEPQPQPQPQPQTLPQPFKSPTTLNRYTDTNPPNAAQLSYANTFFTRGTPSYLFSSTKFRTLPRSQVPEVAFLGRSNVGKSSLLNALLHRTGSRLAHVSKKPGRTRAMNAFGVGGEGGGIKKSSPTSTSSSTTTTTTSTSHDVRWIGPGGLVVLDMPGYGHGSQDDWGREITKYLRSRQQLRRVFVLIDAEHGPKPTDAALCALLRASSIAYQVVLSKVDKLVWPRAGHVPSAAALQTSRGKLEQVYARVVDVLLDGGDGGGDILACSAERFVSDAGNSAGQMLGVDALRWAVLAATGLECDAAGRKRRMRVGEDIVVLDEPQPGFEPYSPRTTRVQRRLH